MQTSYILCVLFLLSSFVWAQDCSESGVRTYAKELAPQLTTTQRQKTSRAAKASSIRTMTHAQHSDDAWLSKLRVEIMNQLGSSLANSADIDELIFVVMMNVYESAEQDLKDLMAQVKQQNEAKQALRDNMDKMREYMCDLKKKMKDDGRHQKP